MRLTSWLRARVLTITASAVSTTTTSSRPTAATRRSLACTSVLRQPSSTTSPSAALPASSLGSTCHTASQAPRSFQPASSGTTCIGRPAGGTFSITA